uniref:Uncharacterized protein n=1 Tax=Anaerolinea thermolimosa TaxID=229919 RepID=A0A7C4PKW7_9CHLR
MSKMFETIGAFSGKMASKPGLISGAMSTMDAKVVADAVNQNAAFMSQLVGNLDPKALATVINRNPEFLTRLIKELDPEQVAASVNKNQRFVTKLVEALQPNVFSRSVNVVFNKMRRATFRPGSSQAEAAEG